jgi:glycosyltransferase involved in cell wall biosynthesis
MVGFLMHGLREEPEVTHEDPDRLALGELNRLAARGGRPLNVDVVFEDFGRNGPNGVKSAIDDLLAWLQRANIPFTVNHPTGCGPLWVQTIGPRSIAQAISSRQPVLCSAHLTAHSLMGSIRAAAPMQPLVRAWMRFAYNSADTLLVPSVAAMRELEKIGVRSRMIKWHPPLSDGILRASTDTAAVAKRKIGLEQGDFAVVSVGQLQPRKGISHFLELALTLPRMHFVWVGGRTMGQLGPKPFAGIAGQAIPPNVHFLATVSRAQMPIVYRAADAFLLLSHHETHCLAAEEARSHGLPLVLSDIPVFRELFGDASVASGSPTSLTRAVEMLSDLQKSRESLRRSATEGKLPQ